MRKLLKSVGQQEVEFLDYKLHFHVLDNGQKIIEEDDVNKFVKDMMAGKIAMTHEDIATLNEYIKGEL